MTVLKYLLLISLSLSASSCSARRNASILGDSKLLISIEERDFKNDRVAQYNFFDNGLKQGLVTHGSELFNSKLEILKKKELEKIKDFAVKLQDLDYENSFPWKEGLYDRGSVYKISFAATKSLEYISRKNPSDKKEIQTEKILYYYQGHKESPKLFKDLIAFIQEL